MPKIDHNIQLSDNDKTICDASLSEIILYYGVKHSPMILVCGAILFVYYCAL